jgi:hypothetical protein
LSCATVSRNWAFSDSAWDKRRANARASIASSDPFLDAETALASRIASRSAASLASFPGDAAVHTACPPRRETRKKLCDGWGNTVSESRVANDDSWIKKAGLPSGRRFETERVDSMSPAGATPGSKRGPSGLARGERAVGNTCASRSTRVRLTARCLEARGEFWGGGAPVTVIA